MKTIKFFGRSDDLPSYDIIHEDGRVEQEELGGEKMYFRLHSNQSQQFVNVWVKYGVGKSDTWGAAPYLRSDGDELPDWNFRYELAHEYSMALLMDVPDDTVVMVEP